MEQLKDTVNAPTPLNATHQEAPIADEVIKKSLVGWAHKYFSRAKVLATTGAATLATSAFFLEKTIASVDLNHLETLTVPVVFAASALQSVSLIVAALIDTDSGIVLKKASKSQERFPELRKALLDADDLSKLDYIAVDTLKKK